MVGRAKGLFLAPQSTNAPALAQLGTPLSPPPWSYRGFGFGCPPACTPGCWWVLWGSAGPSSAATAPIYSSPWPPRRLAVINTDSPSPKRGGLINHDPPMGARVPLAHPGGSGLSHRVAAGSEVVARGREQPRVSLRGHQSHNAALCPWYHRGRDAGAGTTRGCGWHDTVPLPGTGTARGAAAPPERGDAAGQPVPVPEALVHRVGDSEMGTGWLWRPPHFPSSPSALGWLIPVPTAGGGTGTCSLSHDPRAGWGGEAATATMGTPWGHHPCPLSHHGPAWLPGGSGWGVPRPPPIPP